jgi:hypothetical protein
LDDTYTYPADPGQRLPISQTPARESYPGLDDPGMEHWTDPNSVFYQGRTNRFIPGQNIVPLDEAMAGTQAPLIPGRPSVAQNPPPPPPEAPPAEPTLPSVATPAPSPMPEATPPAWMPPDPATQSQTTYAPEDTDRNGIVTEIERWLFHQQSNPEERVQEWLEANVWSKGNTADMATGMIIDGQTGQPLGRLPNFE